jgi:DNA-binding response OmpR family regulator
VHVLVVDDDEHIREVCRSVAEASGMNFVSAYDFPTNLQYPKTDRAPEKEEMMLPEELELIVLFLIS